MADIDDRWYRLDRENGARVPTSRHGTGKRWVARWRDDSGPGGTVRQRKRSFTKRSDAERWLGKITSDLAAGQYFDPAAGRVALRAYAEAWLKVQTFDASTREAVERRLRLYVYPTLGDRPLRALRPSEVQAWLRALQARLAPSTTRVAFTNLSAVLSAAVDDKLIASNPCKPRSVKPPAPDRRKVTPWSAGEVERMLAALPERYRPAGIVAAGLGLRQGEAFGLSADDVDFLRRVVHLRRQVKIIGGKLLYAPPKGGKTRDVPLPEWVALQLAAHIQAHPPVTVTLPWVEPAGKPTTARLLLNRDGGAVSRGWFDLRVWVPALKAAGIDPTEPDRGCHGLRHTYASVLLEGGVSIKAVAENLGHADAAFTLRTYAHVMPTAEDRARQAVDAAFGSTAGAPDVPQEGR